MAIDTSAWTNFTGIEDLLIAPNTISGGLFGTVIFGLLYLVMFMVFAMAGARHGSAEPEKEAFLASSVIMAPLSYYLAILGMVANYLTIIPTVLAVVGIIVIARKNS